MRRFGFRSFALSALLLLQPVSALSDPGTAAWRSDLKRQIRNGGVYAEDQQGRVLFEHRADDQFVPASVMKITTAACALDLLGPDYRYKTEVLLDSAKRLYIKGAGDPSMVSEELLLLAQQVAAKVREIEQVVIDDSLFQPGLVLDGTVHSLNPYDAVNGAFLVNFNTVNFTKTKGGQVLSAEPQTPVTPITQELAKKVAPGTHRINIGKDPRRGALYAGELITAFLRKAGVRVNSAPKVGLTPAKAASLLTYSSRNPLSEIVRGLLQYSTNYTTNQVFLTLGLKQFGPQATAEKGQSALQSCLSKRFGLKQFTAVEGSGLSRSNRFTPRELVSLLRKFEQHSELVTEKEGFLAKTGTLTGVSSLAGYFDLPESVGADSSSAQRVRFAILINDKVPADYRYTIAKKLKEGLSR